MRGVNLYLVGMMGAGKSTVGRLLAQQLNYRFVDTDDLIQKSTGKTIPDIFATEGEPAFRAIETAVLAQVSAYTHMAIATGGGIVTQRQNWSYLHHGIVVWLDVSAEQIYQRLQGDTSRPLLQTEEPAATLQQLLDQRSPLYAQADLTVTIAPDESPEQVAARVLDGLKDVLKPQAAIAPEHNGN